MPELPEVETTRRGLAPRVTGATSPPYGVRRAIALAGSRRFPRCRGTASGCARAPGQVPAVPLRAKASGTILCTWDDWQPHLAEAPPPRRPHDHLDLCSPTVRPCGITTRGASARSSGTPRTTPPTPCSRASVPSPWPPPSMPTTCTRRLRGRRAAIKGLLMDEHIVVGVGNIYAAEALFRAGIRAYPARRSRLARTARPSRRSDPRRARRPRSTRGGTTLRDYVGSAGEPGTSSTTTDVYGREGCRAASAAPRSATAARASGPRPTAPPANRANIPPPASGRGPCRPSGRPPWRSPGGARACLGPMLHSPSPRGRGDWRSMCNRANSQPVSRPTAIGGGDSRRGYRCCTAGSTSRSSPTPRSSKGAGLLERHAPGQARRGFRRGVLARQVGAHQRDLLRRLRRAPAALGRRAHDDVPDRAAARPVAAPVDPAAAHRDARPRTRRSPSTRTIPTSG